MIFSFSFHLLLVISDLCGPAVLQLVLQGFRKTGIAFLFSSLEMIALICEVFSTLSGCVQPISSTISISKTCVLVLN